MRGMSRHLYFSLGLLAILGSSILEANRWGAGDSVWEENSWHVRDWESTNSHRQYEFHPVQAETEWQRSGGGSTGVATPIPPSGEEIRRQQREWLKGSQQQQEQDYMDEVARHHAIEWEYLNLPARKYPMFYETIRLHNLLPGIEEVVSSLNYLFWIVSGACVMGGLAWRMGAAGDSRQAIHAIVFSLLLIALMGACGPGIRWADDWSYSLSNEIGNLIQRGSALPDEHASDNLVQVLTGIKSSLERARERIWNEQNSSRAQESRSFWEPLANTIRDLMDLLFKGVYYLVCWILDFLLAITLFGVVLAEQIRLLLIYLGYGISPLLIGGMAVPGWQQGVSAFIQGFIGILFWPVGWMICFIICNLASQPLVFSFHEISDQSGGEWYEPAVLGAHIWNAFYQDEHSVLAGLTVGIVILCMGLLIGMFIVTRLIQRLVASCGGMMASTGSFWKQVIAAGTGGGGLSSASAAVGRELRKGAASLPDRNEGLMVGSSAASSSSRTMATANVRRQSRGRLDRSRSGSSRSNPIANSAVGRGSTRPIQRSTVQERGEASRVSGAASNTDGMTSGDGLLQSAMNQAARVGSIGKDISSRDLQTASQRLLNEVLLPQARSYATRYYRHRGQSGGDV